MLTSKELGCFLSWVYSLVRVVGDYLGAPHFPSSTKKFVQMLSNDKRISIWRSKFLLLTLAVQKWNFRLRNQHNNSFISHRFTSGAPHIWEKMVDTRDSSLQLNKSDSQSWRKLPPTHAPRKREENCNYERSDKNCLITNGMWNYFIMWKILYSIRFLFRSTKTISDKYEKPTANMDYFRSVPQTDDDLVNFQKKLCTRPQEY